MTEEKISFTCFEGLWWRPFTCSVCYRLGNGTRITDEKPRWNTIYQTIKYSIYRDRGQWLTSQVFFSPRSRTRINRESLEYSGGLLGVFYSRVACVCGACKYVGASNGRQPHAIQAHAPAHAYHVSQSLNIYSTHQKGGWICAMMYEPSLHVFCVCVCAWPSRFYTLCFALDQLVGQRWMTDKQSSCTAGIGRPHGPAACLSMYVCSGRLSMYAININYKLSVLNRKPIPVRRQRGRRLSFRYSPFPSASRALSTYISVAAWIIIHVSSYIRYYIIMHDQNHILIENTLAQTILYYYYTLTLHIFI